VIFFWMIAIPLILMVLFVVGALRETGRLRQRTDFTDRRRGRVFFVCQILIVLAWLLLPRHGLAPGGRGDRPPGGH